MRVLEFILSKENSAAGCRFQKRFIYTMQHVIYVKRLILRFSLYTKINFNKLHFSFSANANFDFFRMKPYDKLLESEMRLLTAGFTKVDLALR